MKKETLKYLKKDDLIEIITSDRMWERKAFMRVLDIVTDKVDSIIDEQAKCDFRTVDGQKRYFELEKEYKKWSDIQMNL